MLFNRFKNINVCQANTTMDLFEVKKHIQNNPEKHKHLKLWSLKKSDADYTTIKNSLTNISVHGTFNETRANANIKQFSGVFFFDVDSDDITSIEALKTDILAKHKDKICLLSKSCGGKGVSFYVRVSNPEVINADNFKSINSYFRSKVFADIKTDKAVNDIQRVHYLPYDVNVYTDFNNEVEIPVEIYNQIDELNKRESTCIKIKPISCNTSTFPLPTYIDIRVLWDKWILKTQINYTGGPKAMLLVDEDGNGLDTCKVHFGKKIIDGKRHKTLRAQMQHILFLNYHRAGVTLLELQSFIHYLNINYCINPISQHELLRTVEREYNKFLAGEGYVTLKKKFVKANPSLPAKEKQKEGSRMYQQYRKGKSIKIIKIGIELLQAQGDAITPKKVCDAIKNSLSLRCIKTHWKTLFPNEIRALPALEIKETYKQSTMEKTGQELEQTTAQVQVNSNDETEPQIMSKIEFVELYDDVTKSLGTINREYSKYVWECLKENEEKKKVKSEILALDYAHS